MLPWVLMPTFWIYANLDSEWQHVVGATAGAIVASVLIYAIVRMINRRAIPPGPD